MKTLRHLLALLGIVALQPACQGDVSGFFSSFPNTVAAVTLRGAQVVPANASAATGTATVTVDGLFQFVDFTVDAAGLGAVNAIEIRLGDPGANGPVLFSIPPGAFPVSGRFVSFFPVGPVTTLGDACAAVAAGHTYLLIRTAAQPGGEIRGHIGRAALASAVLSGAQVPVVSAGTGRADVLLNAAQDELRVTVDVSGLAGILGAGIFDGAPLTPAGATPLFVLTAAPFTSPLQLTLTPADFSPSATVTTFPDAIDALLRGGLFILVQTSGQPGGELRGQIGPTQLRAFLTGGAAAPPSGSTALGAATIVLNATQTAFLVALTHTVGVPTAVGIHAEEDPTITGPLIFDVAAAAGTVASPLAATLKPSHLVAAPTKGIHTFEDALDALLTGRTTVEVSSADFPLPDAEIRGQILP